MTFWCFYSKLLRVISLAKDSGVECSRAILSTSFSDKPDNFVIAFTYSVFPILISNKVFQRKLPDLPFEGICSFAQ